MAERVARGRAARDGLAGVRFTSAGVSDEEHGNPIDPRAAAVLRAAGYDPSGHQAHRIQASEVRQAALVIGMESLHLARVHQLAPDATHLYLLSDFDPDAAPGSGVPDPWYGPDDAFDDTLAAIEAAMPEVLKRAAELSEAS
jgi:protein-tyrosine phosphatase